MVAKGTNARGARTRARLLDAGIQLFAELTTADFLAGLTPKAVAGRAGVTTGSFYTHFADHAAYVDALVEYGLSRQPADDRIATETFERVIAYANAPDTHLIADFHDMADFNFGLSIEEIGVLEFVLAMWTRRRDPRVLELLQGRYRLFQEDYAAGYEIIRQRWNVDWQPPFTHEIGTTIVTCIAEGLSVRHSIDPASVPKEAFGHVLLAFVAEAVRPETPDGESEPRRGFLARHGIRDLEPTYDKEVARPSDAIVDATIALIRTVDLDACSVETIAQQAGVTAGHVYGAWGSRARLATAVVKRLLEPAREQLTFDLELGMPGGRVLDRQLGRLAALLVDMARARPALLSLALQGGIEHLGRPPEDAGNLGVVLFDAIEAARADGSVTAAVDARELARTLAVAVATLALADPSAEADDALAFTRTLVNGVAKRRN